MAEESFERGSYEQSVGLFRQAFLVLPSDQVADGMRHVLVARMAEALMAAHEQDGDPQHLVVAEQVLKRYLAKHELIYGVEEGADRVERMGLEVLLSQVEDKLRPPKRKAAPVELADGGEQATEGAQATQAVVEEEQAIDVHVGEKLDEDGVDREVVVRKSPFATMDDPRVQAYFRSDDFLGPSLMGSGPPALLHPPRVLLRYGASWSEDQVEHDVRNDARADVRAIFVRNRDALLDCYYDAMGRKPLFLARLVVDVTVDEAGVISKLGISKGELIDARGNLCMAQVLAADRIPGVERKEPVTVHFPLTFFFQPQVGVAEPEDAYATSHPAFDESTNQSASSVPSHAW
jgi:hypothetical protein